MADEKPREQSESLPAAEPPVMVPPEISDELPSIEVVIRAVERRDQFVKAAVPIALRSTRASDWTSFGGTPWPMASAIEKIRMRFGISVRNLRYERYAGEDEQGRFVGYRCIGTFRIEGLADSIEAVGTASSRKMFWGLRTLEDGTREARPLFEVNEENLMKHAYTNCLANGVIALVGLKGITWEDLERYGIEKGKATHIQFRSTKRELQRNESQSTAARVRQKKPEPEQPDRPTKEEIVAARKAVSQALRALSDFSGEPLDEVCRHMFKHPPDSKGRTYVDFDRINSITDAAWLRRQTKRVLTRLEKLQEKEGEL